MRRNRRLGSRSRSKRQHSRVTRCQLHPGQSEHASDPAHLSSQHERLRASAESLLLHSAKTALSCHQLAPEVFLCAFLRGVVVVDRSKPIPRFRHHDYTLRGHLDRCRSCVHAKGLRGSRELHSLFILRKTTRVRTVSEDHSGYAKSSLGARCFHAYIARTSIW